MALEQLNKTIQLLQVTPIEQPNLIEMFTQNCSEEKKKCFVFNTTDDSKLILVRGVSCIIDILSELPFNKILWCSALFYPVEFYEDKIFECITSRLLTNPNETLLLALQSWMEECGVEFTHKSISIIEEVLNNVEKIGNESLKEVIGKVKTIAENIHSNENEPTFQMKFDPAPISFKGQSMKLPEWMEPSVYSVKILGKDFLTIADQLMICEYSFLKELQPKDYYINTFETTRSNSNVEIYLKWSQSISNWVAHCCINQMNEGIREMAFKNFLELAIKCLEIRNFNSFNSIVNGLTHYSVARMKKTIALRTNEEKDLLMKLVDLQGQIQHSKFSIEHGKPSVPYLKYFVKEMSKIFEEETEIDDTKDGVSEQEELLKMVDISKAIRIGEIIYQLREFSVGPNTLQINKQTNDFFMNGIRSMKLSNSDLFNLSLATEPSN